MTAPDREPFRKASEALYDKNVDPNPRKRACSRLFSMLSRVQSKSGSDAIALDLPGMDLVAGAIDSHVHCCPHINARTVTVFDAVRQAARAGMRAIGLMDVFANTSGLAALGLS